MTDPYTEAKRRQARILVVALGAGLAMTAGMGTVMYLLMSSTGDHTPPEPGWIGQDEAAVPAPAPARAEAPSPSPLGGAEAGYGRPEPLFSSDGGATDDDGHAAPLFIDPEQDDGIPDIPVREVPTTIPTAGSSPDTGDLPGRFGNPYARVRLVVFNDLQCPYCSKLEPTFEALRERYPSQIEVFFRDFPLDMHRNARGAHMAARCAHDQGRFWDMHDLLFANQRELGSEALAGYAASLGLDLASFERCLHEGHHAVAIDRDIAAGKAVGVTGTPATYVNGVEVRGARTVHAFIEVIDAAL